MDRLAPTGCVKYKKIFVFGKRSQIVSFLEEPVPPRGIILPVLPGVSRIVADNPSAMTYHGTNSWLIESGKDVVVIDPGPEDEKHLHDVLAGIKERTLKYILLTHTHPDHSGNAMALKEATGAPIAVYKRPFKKNIIPDVALDDGEVIEGFTAIYTPGHARDHLSFQFFGQNGAKILFSGDHVMSWSSSIVNPPDGDMLSYYRSLELLLHRDDDLYLCGHGPMLKNPRILVAELLAHRQLREKTIIAELQAQDWGVASLAAKLYHKENAFLKIAAQRNVLAHLLKLTAEGIAEEHQPDTTPHPDVVAMINAHGTPNNATTRLIYQDSLRKFGLAKAA